MRNNGRVRELLKFSHEKKRMTIVVELPDKLVLTLTKGSDVSVRDCLSDENKESADTQVIVCVVEQYVLWS